MTQLSPAELIDELVVSAVVSQTVNGIITPDVFSVVLKRLEESWLVEFYLSCEPSEELTEDLQDVGGDAEISLLSPFPPEWGNTAAIHWPIACSIKVDPERVKYFESLRQLPRSKIILFVRPPEA